jgi:hypothetical protein
MKWRAFQSGSPTAASAIFGSVCPIAACAVSGCVLSYSSMCCLWTRLSYSSRRCLSASGHVCHISACDAFGRGCYISAAFGRICPTGAWAASGPMAYTSISCIGRICFTCTSYSSLMPWTSFSSLSCLWPCLSYKQPLLPIDVSVLQLFQFNSCCRPPLGKVRPGTSENAVERHVQGQHRLLWNRYTSIGSTGCCRKVSFRESTVCCRKDTCRGNTGCCRTDTSNQGCCRIETFSL